MADGQIAQHQASAVVVPVTGDGLNPATVRATQDATIDTYNDHDADPSIHFLSGALTARPAYNAVVPGTKYVTTDSPRLIYISTASGWVALDYSTTMVVPDQYFYLFATRI